MTKPDNKKWLHYKIPKWGKEQLSYFNLNSTYWGEISIFGGIQREFFVMNCWNLHKHTTINNEVDWWFVACQHASLCDTCKPETDYRAGMRSSFTCITCFTPSDTPYGVSNSSKVKILNGSKESHCVKATIIYDGMYNLIQNVT